jgi:predicted phosphoribosyltransferase
MARRMQLTVSMETETRFENRRDAGRRLASLLAKPAPAGSIVLALPRGGVVVGYEVAAGLGIPLDVFVVRKLGVPGFEELAMGAVASGGTRIVNREVVSMLSIPEATIDEVAKAELTELSRRERMYRRERPALDVREHHVFLVDDGLATGSSMVAAIAVLRRRGVSGITVAAPVGAPDTCAALRGVVDNVVCLTMPNPFGAVGLSYVDFTPTTDEEVRGLLIAQGRHTNGVGASYGVELSSATREEPDEPAHVQQRRG